MNSYKNHHLFVIAGVSVAFLSALLYYKKKSKDFIPKEWKRVGEITELLCFPIKSCGPIRVDNVNCSILGIENDKMRDRVFMVTKLDGEFTTARNYPTLVKIQPCIENNILKLTAPGMIDISINIVDLYNIPTNRTVCWNEEVDSIDCGEEVAKWISRFILSENFGLRLVYFPSKLPTRGVREKNMKFQLMNRNDSGALHDASSYMLMNENSLNDLNTRLDEKVNAVRFRPNFVVKGPSAYEEDTWQWVKIGNDVIFRTLKPCTRCIFTNVDPDNGSRNKEGEPLKTLKSYRLFPETGDSPVMGIHLGIRKNGTISIGDDVYIPA